MKELEKLVRPNIWTLKPYMIIWSQKGSSSVTATRSPYAKTASVLQSVHPKKTRH